MIIRKLFIILFLIAISQIATAQDIPQVTQGAETDTIVTKLPDLTLDYYNDNTVVNRNYDYELINRKLRLESRATNVSLIGIITGVLVYTSVSTLIMFTADFDMNPLLVVTALSSGAVAGFFVYVPFQIWSNKLKQRAQSIEVSPMIGLNASGFGVNVKLTL